MSAPLSPVPSDWEEAPYKETLQTHRRLAELGQCLQLNGDVNAQSVAMPGATLLMSAAALPAIRQLEDLLHRGADIHARNAEGKSALDLAREGGHRKAVSILENRLLSEVSARAAEEQAGSQNEVGIPRKRL